MNDKTANHELFLEDLRALLRNHSAEIKADDKFDGWAESGQDVRMTVEFWDDTEIDLGSWIDGLGHGGRDEKPDTAS